MAISHHLQVSSRSGCNGRWSRLRKRGPVIEGRIVSDDPFSAFNVGTFECLAGQSVPSQHSCPLSAAGVAGKPSRAGCDQRGNDPYLDEASEDARTRKATQTWLGHSNSRITLDTYTHAAIDQQQKEAAQQLAQGLFAQPESPAQERTEVVCGLSCALATLTG